MDWTFRRYQRRTKRLIAATALLLGAGIAPALHPFSALAGGHTAAPVAASPGCQLDPARGAIKHVIFIEFDNVHRKRDAARDGSTNVPSDLEQIPNLLNFIKGNGTLLTNYHMPLISHTSDDITSSESGLYPSRNGVANSANSYFYYDSAGNPNSTSGFTYWTSKIPDGQYNFVSPATSTATGPVNAPAPWVPYTRAGCNVGAVAMSGLVLESKGDIGQAFGTSSPQYNDPNYFPNEIGVAVHCGKGDGLCSSANGGAPDTLPNEPPAPDGSDPGYTGYSALYGSQPLARAINGGAPLQDINGNTIVDQFTSNGVTTTTPGFPGFSTSPQYSLGYVADMQERGIPVTYAYIITAHRPLPANPYGYGHPEDRNDYSPGEAHYVDQLRQYNDAFGKFFQRLANDGINKSNTLFVVTTDEEDHHINGLPSPRGCDGVTVPCTYQQSGELSVNTKGLLQGETGTTTPVQVNQDDAPDLYLNGNPGPADPTTRNFERALGKLTLTNPLSVTLGVPANENPTQYLADPTEFKILHMLTADPLRTPTVVDFGQPDYYFLSGAYTTTVPSSCGANPAVSCVRQDPSFNWNHGDVQPEITTAWLGLAGPGVQNRGQDDTTFADHPDTVPTILSLAGLRGDTTYDGRPLVEDFTPDALPPALRGGARLTLYRQLGQVYKQLNAPVGQFGLNTLNLSTQGLESGSAGDDSAFTKAQSTLTSLGAQRDTLGGRMAAVLDRLAFTRASADPFNPRLAADFGRAKVLTIQGQLLLRQAAIATGGAYTNPVTAPAASTASTTQAASVSGASQPGSASALALGIVPLGVALLYRRRRRATSKKTA